VASWIVWGVFVLEFVLRAVIAPSTSDFLRRNWWQLVFLALPFFRFVRILARLRLARLGRVVSSAVRSTRTATARLSGRLGWLSAVTAIVVLSASQLLYETTPYPCARTGSYRPAGRGRGRGGGRVPCGPVVRSPRRPRRVAGGTAGGTARGPAPARHS